MTENSEQPGVSRAKVVLSQVSFYIYAQLLVF